MQEVKVSVIMGVYNQWDKEILKKAVDSILNQTLTNLELIIYDDGSDEEVAQYIRQLSELDERIVALGKKENHGLAYALNECIRIARGSYIARMDADDIAMPERLQVQVDFLEKHREYSWCGTNAVVFDENGIWSEREMPETPEAKDYLKFSPYIHPSVMYREELFRGEDIKGYCVSKETLRCEDYEIFMRLYQNHYKGYNIQQNLLCYREDQNSYKRRKLCFRISEAKIRYRNFKKMNMLFPTGWIYVLRPIIAGLIPRRMMVWLKRKSAGDKKYAGRTYEQVDGVL